jgi:endonuclease YncB( thermonuclease family)
MRRWWPSRNSVQSFVRRSRAVIDAPYVCEAPRAGDGDSISCGQKRLRLVGIDAPVTSQCRRGRVCVAGDGQASKRSLAQGLKLGPVRYRRVTVDRYGRIVAAVYAGGMNLSCYQLSDGGASYVARWDTGSVARRECR